MCQDRMRCLELAGEVAETDGQEALKTDVGNRSKV